MALQRLCNLLHRVIFAWLMHKILAGMMLHPSSSSWLIVHFKCYLQMLMSQAPPVVTPFDLSFWFLWLQLHLSNQTCSGSNSSFVECFEQHDHL